MLNTSLTKQVRAMGAQIDYGEQQLQMDDYGIDKRPYGRHGDCTISPTYDDEDTHHCGEDINEEGGQDETDEELQS